MFGGNKPFGTNTSFGSSSPGSSLFGSNQNKTGMFGSNTTTQSSSLFGQKQTATPSLFGSSTNQQQSGGSLFGGSTANNNAGGGGLFGSSTQNKSLFGGATTQQTSTFGSSSGGGLFGSSTQQSSGGSLFGGATSGNAPNGTTIKFNPLVQADSMMKNGVQQSIQTKNFCISAMKEYEGKSFEELRVDDYIANRKAPTAGSSSGGLFGSTANTSTGGLFGSSTQQPKSLFGSPAASTNVFGSSTPTQSTSIFGQNQQQQQQQSGGLFGNKPATGGLFGGSSTTPSSFGTATNTSGSLFGNTATSTSSPFGSTQQPTSTFGSTFGTNTQPQQSGGLFGNTGATNTSFGAPATGGGLFGNAQQQQQNTGGGLFGKPVTSNTGFGFGTTSQPATSTAGGGLFGNTAAKPGGLFGSTTTTAGGGLFGSTTTQPAGGGLFGSTQPAQQTGGLFGNTQQQQAGTVVVSNPATVEVAAKPIILGSDVNETMLKMAMIEASLATNPYGDSPLLKLTNTVDSDDNPNPTSAARQMRFLKKVTDSANATSPTSGSDSPASNKNKISFLSMNIPVAGSKVRSRAIAIGGDLSYKSTRTPPTLGKGIGGKTPRGANSSLANTTLNGSLVNKTVDSAIERALNTSSNGLPGSARRSHIKHLDLDEIKSAMKSGGRAATATSPRDDDELPPVEIEEYNANDSITVDPREAVRRRREEHIQPIPRLNLDATTDSVTSATSPVAAEKENRSPPSARVSNRANLEAAGVTLKTEDYFCEPSIREMASMVVDGKVVLPHGLTVGRATFGNVFWPGPLEISNIALDEVVIFRHKEVTVYPDESVKPPLGEGLNRPAEVTLERVWHVNRETHEEIKDPIVLAEIGWRDRLDRVTLKMGAVFRDYRPATGSWVFRVEHFSKYGLPDDEEDAEVPAAHLRRLKERELHSRVQRTNVCLNEVMDTEEVVDDIIFVNAPGAPATPVSTRRGLGGDEDLAQELEELGDQQIPPEKKPKLESNDQVVEDSKRLMDILMSSQIRIRPEKPMLKCVEATRSFKGGKPVSETVGKGQSQWIDLGSARGNSARVGWSAHGLFVKSAQPGNNSVVVRSLDRAGDFNQDFITDMLEHNIRLSQAIKRNHSISAKVRHHELDGQQVAPRIKPTNDHAQLIDSFCATAHQSHRSDDERVWKLLKALFPGSRDGQWRWERLENVCNWLREEVSRLPKLPSDSERGSAVWSTLCRGHLEEAISIALEDGLLHLGALLSLFQVDPRGTQQDFLAQIAVWEKVKMLEHVETPILKIYLLMAGRLSVSFSKRGRDVKVSCIDGLNWKQSMGIFLWYLRGFRCYEETVEDAFSNVPAPTRPDDILFLHLLKLSRNNAYSIEAVLDAAVDFCPSVFDHLMCWHLWSVLRSIGYNTMSPEAEQRLHSAYSEQLIANNLSHLALFVLSHISNDQSRSAAMRECLNRVAMVAEKSDFDRMSAITDIPKAWIAAAKYINAKSSEQVTKACEMALLAGDLTTAYRLFVSEVAPNAVLSQEMPELVKLLAMFEPVADRIPGWGQQGQLYADYMEMKNMSMVENDEDDDLKVSELLSSMMCKLQAPVFETPLQRLCAQNIGLEMFEMHRLLTGNCSFEMPLDIPHLSAALRRSVNIVGSSSVLTSDA